MSNTTITPGAGEVDVVSDAPTSGVQAALLRANGAGALAFAWNEMTAGAVGAPTPWPGSWPGPLDSISFVASGAFGSGGGLQLEGSNDGISWTSFLSPLSAPGAIAPMSLRAGPRLLRPRVTGGDATTAITVAAVLG